MQLKEYMNETFPGVTLVPHIYFQWENHFHFGKGKGLFVERTDDVNREYFTQLYT